MIVLKIKENLMKRHNFLTKFLKTFVVCLLVLPCVFAFSGCKSDNELLSKIEKLQAQIDALEAANKNNNNQIDTYDLYLQAVENDEFDGSYLDFIKSNLVISSDTTSTVANKCAASVVSVYAYNSLNSSNHSSGSGVIYSIDNNGNAIVVTNYHITYNDASKSAYKFYNLRLYGQDSTKIINAEFVGGSADYDISVLKVTASDVLKNSNAQAVSLDTSNIKLGTTCLAIGNPDSNGISVTRGIVSRDSENVKMSIAGEDKYRRVIRHDAYITYGSSGGGLFDMNGNLVGVTNGGERDENHINYAIPASTVDSVVKNILINCLNTSNTKLQALSLNALTVTAETSSAYNKTTGFIDIVDTVVFGEISNNSILKTNNKIKSGDIIKTLVLNAGTVNETTLNLTRAFEIKEFLLKAEVGDSLKIIVNRVTDGETETITASFDITSTHIETIN